MLGSVMVSHESTDGALGEVCVSEREPLPPADLFDPVIEAYKQDVDRTLLRENLKLTTEQRSQKLLDFARFAHELQEAGRRARENNPRWGLK